MKNLANPGTSGSCSFLGHTNLRPLILVMRIILHFDTKLSYNARINALYRLRNIAAYAIVLSGQCAKFSA